MRYIELIIFIGIILILDGCSGTVGKNFNASKAQGITNGTTTKLDIKKMFGAPFKTGVQNGQPLWVYEYNQYNILGGDTSKDLIIIFDQTEVVQSHQFMSSKPTP